MAKSNFDDFLLGPSFDDLDAIHQEAERQLLRNGGGLRKLAKKVKAKLTSKKKKNKLVKAANNASTSKSQAAEIEKVASTNPKGSQQMGKPTKDTPKKDSTKSTKKPGDKLDAPKPKVKSLVKTPEVKKTIKKVQTKRGTGVTYKAAWEANKNNVKSKYKTYAEFKSAAEAYNKKKDAEANKKKVATSAGKTAANVSKAKSTIDKSKNQKITLTGKPSTGGLSSGKTSKYGKLPGQGNTVRARGEAARAAYEKEQAVKADSRQKAKNARDKKAKYSTNSLESGGVKKKINKSLRPKY